MEKTIRGKFKIGKKIIVKSVARFPNMKLTLDFCHNPVGGRFCYANKSISNYPL